MSVTFTRHAPGRRLNADRGPQLHEHGKTDPVQDRLLGPHHRRPAAPPPQMHTYRVGCLELIRNMIPITGQIHTARRPNLLENAVELPHAPVNRSSVHPAQGARCGLARPGGITDTESPGRAQTLTTSGPTERGFIPYRGRAKKSTCAWRCHSESVRSRQEQLEASPAILREPSPKRRKRGAREAGAAG